MRVLIDLDALISPDSYGRGIGRYSLGFVKSLLEEPREHEFLFCASQNLLNGAPEDALLALEDLTQRNRVNPIPSFGLLPSKVNAAIRDHAIQQLQPDAILVLSPFERACGFPPTRRYGDAKCVVVLYDVIPLALSNMYLPTHEARADYFSYLNSLHCADLALCISEWTAKDARELVGLPPEMVRTISIGLDDAFISQSDSITQQGELTHLGIVKPYVFYVGGDDDRKNIAGLIIAFSELPREVRSRYQLVVTCRLSQGTRARHESLVESLGLGSTDVVLTGELPDLMLASAYRNTSLFVFPSFYEGFGLPIVEAMASGAPVIGSATTSVGEVIALDKALFDPKDSASISTLMEAVLSQPVLRRELVEHGVRRSRDFTWRRVATRALDAIEAVIRTPDPVIHVSQRPRLAVVTPLPPDETGIATFSETALPFLARHYDITVIRGPEQPVLGRVGGFPSIDANSLVDDVTAFDRVLYQFGNSEFHRQMPDLLHQTSGVVELHDVFLGGLHSTRGLHAVQQEFAYAHGRSARELAVSDIGAAAARYPASALAIDESLAVIVHSKSAADLLFTWYGLTDGMFCIPMNLRPYRATPRTEARRRLTLHDDDILVASFGFAHPSKLSEELLAAWRMSKVAKNYQSSFIFVGGSLFPDDHVFGDDLIGASDAARWSLTGFVDDEAYSEFLTAADVVVQLRSGSRGETSGAYLDAIVSGRALIVNDNPAFPRELDAGLRLSASPGVKEVAEAIDAVVASPTLKADLEAQARQVASTELDPTVLARSRFEAIEWAYSKQNRHNPLPLARAFSQIMPAPNRPAAAVLADIFPRRTEQRLHPARNAVKSPNERHH